MKKRLIGATLGNTCKDCDSYARLEEIEENIYVLKVFHSDECPELLKRSRNVEENLRKEQSDE